MTIVLRFGLTLFSTVSVQLGKDVVSVIWSRVPAIEGFLKCTKVDGDAIGTFVSVHYIAGVRSSGVSV